MRDCLVIGRPNVGKTLFILSFAEYAGMRRIAVEVRECDGRTETKPYILAQARRELVSERAHTTRSLQSVVIEMPAGKGTKRFQLTDTVGLTDHIHEEYEIRKAIAQTLAAVLTARVVLHVVDAALAGQDGVSSALGEIDYQVARFAECKGAYAILANKMDLPGARAGFPRLAAEFPGRTILPVSALYRRGFREVALFVRRNI